MDNLKKYLPYQSEFSHQCASWARNHAGWAKMKKDNRRLAKVRMKRDIVRDIETDIHDTLNKDNILEEHEHGHNR